MTDSRLQSDLQRLAARPAAKAALGTPKALAELPDRTGTAGRSSGTAGIASPLVEADYTLREWHATQQVQTSDGVFVFDVRFLKKIVMSDANGREVVQEFQDKPA